MSATDTRAPLDVGRRARLDVAFARRNGATVLTHGYAEPPMRVGRAIERCGQLQLIVASSAPGLFGGDSVEQTIDVAAGADVKLTSQSALQVHPSTAGGVARARARYKVHAGARLSCFWDPVIPFTAASFDQEIEIDVEPGGRLTWSDALMCGREGSGERWAFHAVAHQLRLRYAGRLAYLERYRILPGSARQADPWRAGGHTYFGTIFRIGCGDVPALAEAIHAELNAMSHVKGTADLLAADDLLLVRIAAESGVPFHRARAVVDQMLSGDQNR